MNELVDPLKLLHFFWNCHEFQQFSVGIKRVDKLQPTGHLKLISRGRTSLFLKIYSKLAAEKKYSSAIYMFKPSSAIPEIWSSV
jgi:hypothetical protein